jgi:cation-transporting P-type ATPase F
VASSLGGLSGEGRIFRRDTALTVAASGHSFSRMSFAPAHTQSPEQVVASLATHAETGLEPAVAQRRYEQNGPNRLTMRAGPSAWRRFAAQLTQPLVLILLVAAVVKLTLADPVDAAVIGLVVLLNAVIGYLQESRAEQAIAALDALVVTEATVVRGGRKQRIASQQLVVGDIVALQSGDGVPADVRLLSTRELQVEEAALTGESLPVHKQPQALSTETGLADRTNMAFAGTNVTYGTATAVVVATGDVTETGRIAGLLAQAAPHVTPLTRRIEGLSRLLLWVILAVAAGMVVFEVAGGASWAEAFDAAVALAVGAIPEGLPAAVTVLLAVGVASMAKRGALIRKLPAVETLGSTTVICSDKTGTLTENQMTVRHGWAAQESFQLSGIGYSQTGEVTGPKSGRPALQLALLAGALCNDSRLVTKDGRVLIEGDPTEGALLVAAQKARIDASGYRRIDLLPFESQHMYMAVLTQSADGYAVWVKGSSDALLKRCTSMFGVEGPFERETVAAQVDGLARQGLRVLVLARKVVGPDVSHATHALVDDGLVFLGLVGMMDPPRAEAKVSIAACQAAGIRVKMITGDHLSTAAAIAEQLGIKGRRDGQGQLVALAGGELENISDTELPALAEDVAVFARVAPEQKLRLVKALQNKGHVVAMTGDGVNDAPALKQADLGVAMGITGTDVARRAAAMVLTDDNFSTISAAVEEGRAVFERLLKFLAWSLPTNGAQGFTLLVAVLAGVNLPILPVQMLWVNMATAVLIGTALIFEPAEAGLMQVPPRPVAAPLLDRGLLVRIAFVSVVSAAVVFGAWYWARSIDGLSEAAARTVAVNGIVVVSVAYLFNCRSLRRPMWALGLFSNRWVWVGSAVMILAQLAFTYLPALQRLFHTEGISAAWWLRLTVGGLLVFAVVEVKKLVT